VLRYWLLLQVLAGCADGSCVLVDSSSGSQLLRWAAQTAAVQSLLWLVPPPNSSSSSSSSSSEVPSNSVIDSAQAQQVPRQQDEAAQISQSTEGQEPHSNSLQDKANSSSIGLESTGNGSAVNLQQQQQYVITAGADKSVKLWQLLQRLPQQQPAADSTEADADPAAITSTNATSAAAAAATDAGTAVTLPSPEVQLAAAAAVRQPTGGGGSWQQGKHSSMYYGAVALVPGSMMSDGSCMVLMTGMAGGVMLAAMVPGRRNASAGACDSC
jgi:hypothetical protein